MRGPTFGFPAPAWWFITVTPVPGILYPLLTSVGTMHIVIHRYTYRKVTHTHKIIRERNPVRLDWMVFKLLKRPDKSFFIRIRNETKYQDNGDGSLGIVAVVLMDQLIWFINLGTCTSWYCLRNTQITEIVLYTKEWMSGLWGVLHRDKLNVFLLLTCSKYGIRLGSHWSGVWSSLWFCSDFRLCVFLLCHWHKRNVSESCLYTNGADLKKREKGNGRADVIEGQVEAWRH